MNLRIDTDASSLTASKATAHVRPARTSAADGGEGTLCTARSDTIRVGRPATVAARAEAGLVTNPDPSVALELSRGQIATQPAAALQAQANSTPESVLRLLY